MRSRSCGHLVMEECFISFSIVVFWSQMVQRAYLRVSFWFAQRHGLLSLVRCIAKRRRRANLEVCFRCRLMGEIDDIACQLFPMPRNQGSRLINLFRLRVTCPCRGRVYGIENEIAGSPRQCVGGLCICCLIGHIVGSEGSNCPSINANDSATAGGDSPSL